jgi:sec-independent protein translocase protein TatA
MVVAIVAFALFGGKKLPERGEGSGSGLRGFKDGIEGLKDELSSAEVTPAVAANPKTTAFRQCTKATQRGVPREILSGCDEWMTPLSVFRLRCDET